MHLFAFLFPIYAPLYNPILLDGVLFFMQYRFERPSREDVGIQMIDKKYLHPDSAEIQSLICQIKEDAASVQAMVDNLFVWFDQNIQYSRLNAPFFPLQRSDLDVLQMKSGTCGDYANLVVSVLLTLNVPAKYAYVHRDCYGNEQDHICAAAFLEDRWVLIDATLPYRKWHGFDCRHQEYELIAPEIFELRMKKIESACMEKAELWGNAQYAGILYAPWIHEEILLCTDDRTESVFFLLSMHSPHTWTLYVNYLIYTARYGRTPVMAEVTPESMHFQLSVHPAASIWDNGQWGERVSYEDMQDAFCTPELHALKSCIDRVMPRLLDLFKE